MLPLQQFEKITKALHQINEKPVNLKRIPENQRGALMVALECLNHFNNQSHGLEVNGVLQILLLYNEKEIPKTSLAKKIQKAIRNFFGRISHQDLVKAARHAEQELWVKHGMLLLNHKQDKLAFQAFQKASALGSHRAKAYLGQMFLERRAPLDTGLDPTLAGLSYLDAAAVKDPLAQRLVGQYHINLGNQKRGVELLKKAAKQKDPEALKVLRKLKKQPS